MRRRMMVKGQKRSRTQTALLQPCRRKEKQQAARSSRKLQSPVGPGYAVRSAVIALWAYFYTGWAFQQRTGCRLRYIVPLPARPTKDLLATCTISVFVSTEKLPSTLHRLMNHMVSTLCFASKASSTRSGLISGNTIIGDVAQDHRHDLS